jgi:hypothetical protein
LRISFLSNAPWASTGYGQQLKLVVPRLQTAGHQLAIQAFYGHAGSPIDWNGIAVYGVASHPFGLDVMAAHAKNFKADILLSNMDAWVIEPSLMFEQNWVAWFPVDSEPCPPAVIDKVRQAFHRIVWTQLGAREMDKVGLDYDIIPYGVDLDMFKPIDRADARKQSGLPKDKFIVGMVAMNKGYPPRKAFYENITAFKKSTTSTLTVCFTCTHWTVPARMVRRLTCLHFVKCWDLNRARILFLQTNTVMWSGILITP